jgi:hypothetical protein
MTAVPYITTVCSQHTVSCGVTLCILHMKCIKWEHGNASRFSTAIVDASVHGVNSAETWSIESPKQKIGSHLLRYNLHITSL